MRTRLVATRSDWPMPDDPPDEPNPYAYLSDEDMAKFARDDGDGMTPAPSERELEQMKVSCLIAATLIGMILLAALVNRVSQ